MKTLLKTSFLLFLLIGLASCNLQDKLTTDVPIEDLTVDFSVGPDGMLAPGVSQPMKVKADDNAAGAVVLLDHTFDVNVSSEIKKQGLSVNLIKSFLITNASLAITVPDDYEDYMTVLNMFKTVKLYFDDQTQIVAQAQNLTVNGHTGVISIQILNPELLDKLKNDQLHVILTGEGYPGTNVNCTLTTSYIVKVGL